MDWFRGFRPRWRSSLGRSFCGCLCPIRRWIAGRCSRRRLLGRGKRHIYPLASHNEGRRALTVSPLQLANAGFKSLGKPEKSVLALDRVGYPSIRRPAGGQSVGGCRGWLNGWRDHIRHFQGRAWHQAGCHQAVALDEPRDGSLVILRQAFQSFVRLDGVQDPSFRGRADRRGRLAGGGIDAQWSRRRCLSQRMRGSRQDGYQCFRVLGGRRGLDR